MRKAGVAEWMLRLMMPRNEAAAIAGDLLELSAHRGPLWFWTSIASTALAFLWFTLVTSPGRLARSSAYFFSEGALMSDSRPLVGTLWRHKWLLLSPVILAVASTSVWSYSQPVRYRSEATLLIAQAGAGFEDFALRMSPAASRDHIDSTLRRLQSHTRLRRIIEEFDLYQQERSSMVPEDVIARMRRNISLQVVDTDEQTGTHVLKVAFADSDPANAKRVTERLAALLMQESLTSKGVTTKSMVEFLDAQLTEMRDRLAAASATVRRSKAEAAEPDAADVLELDTLKETYTALAQRREQARIAMSLERRMLGQQLRVVEGAEVPKQPVWPNRAGLSLAGAAAGLGLGAALVAIRTRKEGPGR